MLFKKPLQPITSYSRAGGPNTKLASAMSELLKSARMVQMMKGNSTRDSASSGSGRPEHALISLLEVTEPWFFEIISRKT